MEMSQVVFCVLFLFVFRFNEYEKLFNLLNYWSNLFAKSSSNQINSPVRWEIHSKNRCNVKVRSLSNYSFFYKSACLIYRGKENHFQDFLVTYAYRLTNTNHGTCQTSHNSQKIRIVSASLLLWNYLVHIVYYPLFSYKGISYPWDSYMRFIVMRNKKRYFMRRKYVSFFS